MRPWTTSPSARRASQHEPRALQPRTARADSDALVVTVFGAIVSGSPDDAQKTASRLGVVAGGLAFFALTAIGVKIVCALVALYVRYMSGRPRRAEGPPQGSQLWFYARVAELEPAAFTETAAAVTRPRRSPSDSTRSR
jgi:hypothetical protein